MAPNPNRAMLSPKKSFVSMSISSEYQNLLMRARVRLCAFVLMIARIRL